MIVVTHGQSDYRSARDVGLRDAFESIGSTQDCACETPTHCNCALGVYGTYTYAIIGLKGGSALAESRSSSSEVSISALWACDPDEKGLPNISELKE